VNKTGTSLYIPARHAEGETFFCGMCRYSIPLRGHSHKIICVQTLALHEKNDVASCEYAERRAATA
jgi:hypothetical protein